MQEVCERNRQVTLPNDLVRCFALTLRPSPLYAFATTEKQHSIVVKDERIQRCLQKHHETCGETYHGDRYVREITEDYTLPNGFLTRYLEYKPEDPDVIRELRRHWSGKLSLIEQWDHEKFPILREQHNEGRIIGISFSCTRFRQYDGRKEITMKLDLYEENRRITTIYITDDTHEAYDLAYRRIKAIQDIRK